MYWLQEGWYCEIEYYCVDCDFECQDQQEFIVEVLYWICMMICLLQVLDECDVGSEDEE